MRGVGGSGGCCGECRTRCGLIHGPLSVTKSFFKVLIGPDISDLLYIPPKFAPQLSSLIGQKVVLEDSRGSCWRVKLTEHRGSLALRKGWRGFFSDHGLQIGDFLVFHFMGTRFVVKVYDRSACERTELGRGPGNNHEGVGRCLNGGHRARSHLSSNTEAESEDEVVFVRGYEAGQGGSSVSEKQVNLGKGPNPCEHVGATWTRMPDDGALPKVGTDVDSYDYEEILNVNPLAVATYAANSSSVTFATMPSFPDSALGSEPTVGIISQKIFISRRFIRCKLCLAGERMAIKKRGRPRKNPLTMSIKSVSSSFEKLSYEYPITATTPRQVENSAVLQLTGTSSQFPVEANFSLKVTVVSTNYLELPVNLLSILPKLRGMKKSRESRILILEDQLKRLWPVLYREEQVKFLSTGWKGFSEANHISPGDECLLVARDLSKAVFGVSVLTYPVAHSPPPA